MNKVLIMFAAFAMVAFSANAQSVKTRRSATRNHTATTTTNVQAVEGRTANENEGVLDQNTGTTGTDGTINSRATSGKNNSNSVILERSNNTTNGATSDEVKETKPMETRTRGGK